MLADKFLPKYKFVASANPPESTQKVQVKTIYDKSIVRRRFILTPLLLPHFPVTASPGTMKWQVK
jgi:hypothetical protein